MENPLSKTIRSLFRFWTFLYYIVTISKIIQGDSQTKGEGTLFMFVIIGFLLVVYIGIYLAILIITLSTKYFSKLDLCLFLGGIILTLLLYFTKLS